MVASKVGVDASEGPCFIADRHCQVTPGYLDSCLASLNVGEIVVFMCLSQKPVVLRGWQSTSWFDRGLVLSAVTQIHRTGRQLPLIPDSPLEGAWLLLSCIFYFYTWSKHTAHCKHLCLRLSCIFSEVKHKKNKPYLSSFLPHSALFSPFLSVHPRSCLSIHFLPNKLNLSSRESPTPTPPGRKFPHFHLPGKNTFVFLFLKGGFHWG